MANPSFVNAGAFSVGASGTSVSPALPASRVNNNILIAYASTNNNTTISVAGAGWTSFGARASAASFCWAWRIVDGTEAAPTFSWTGAAQFGSAEFQYTGNQTVTPVGTPVTADQSSSTTFTSGAGVTTTTNNATVIGLLALTTGLTPTQNTSSGYTFRTDSIGNGNFGFRLWDGVINVSGLTSETLNGTVNGTAAHVVTSLFELVGSGAAGTDNIRSSQAVTEVLETDSFATNIRSSQAVTEVLETDSFPTKIRSSQVVLEVLRTQSAGSSVVNLQQTFTSVGSGSIVLPNDVTSITVEAWGGGASGGGTSSSTAPGGGGGGYSKAVLAVAPGQTVFYNVGAGGASQAGAGQSGGNSWVNPSANSQPASNGVVGGGGVGGTSGNPAGGAGSVGTTNFTGGAAGNGAATNGGGGGGCAGTTANGTNGGAGGGSPGTGGAGGASDLAGAGSAGLGSLSGTTALALAQFPGGGGGGSWLGSSQYGASGLVRISYLTGTLTSPYIKNNQWGWGAITFITAPSSLSGEAWGGGGGGSQGFFTNAPGGGGGGYSEFLQTPLNNQTYYFFAGRGGLNATSSISSNGDNSWVNSAANSQPASAGCVGGGGSAPSFGGDGGPGGVGTIGTTNFTGGNGGDFDAHSIGGSGGGGAGSAGNGGNALPVTNNTGNSTPGAGGSPDGGAGAQGIGTVGNPAAGTVPGGGGASTFGANFGSAGGIGQVRITWPVPIVFDVLGLVEIEW